MTDSAKPPSGRKMKARAPPPPQVPQPAPRRIFRTGDTQEGIADKDIKENMLRPTLELHLTLPQGFQTTVTEDGSKALMDLLVELCSRYHLNPSLHTLELFTPEGHLLGFKPNALLGSLNVACILIKEKVLEEKLVRRPAPKVPEKTVRLMVNYHGGQKAVVRVNPLLPLQDLVPVICDKCEFDPALVVLLKDSISRHELSLDKSMTQLGIKELYVHDKSLDSMRSSTTSLARAEKKGLLGIFQFNRRKSKTFETTSLDMDDCDDKAFQNTEAHSNAMSGMFGASYVDNLPNTLSQSQSALNISRTSPKAETKKRRAPVPPGNPTPSTEYLNYDSNSLMCLGSESQQRKRKAPAPPPTPVSITSTSDDNSAAATPVSQHTETSRTKVVQSSTVTSVVIQNVTPVAIVTVQPAACSTSLARSSPTPSSSTSESLAVQDSSSELSQSLEDSEAEPGSQCSTSTGSTVSRPAPAQTTKSSTMKKSDVNMSATDVTSTSSSRSDTESAMNLKMEETENQRHSGVAWLHSMQSPAAKVQSIEISTEESVSLGSNSSGSSLPDQGYAASEGMVDGEDSGVVSSPSDTHTTSPDGSLSLDGSTGAERLVGTVCDHFSDSDEGCATWGSQHRGSDVTSRLKTDRPKDQDLSAQLHQTLANLESDLAEHTHVSKESFYCSSRNSREVPVSVVDLDVPVTTIDEVLPEDGFWTETITNSVPIYSVELQNKNNNAHTATDTSKSSTTETKLLSQHAQKEKSEHDMLKTHKKKDCILDSKSKEINKTQVTVKKEAFTEAKSNCEEQMNTNRDIKKEKERKTEKPSLPPVNQGAQNSYIPVVHQNITTSKVLQSNITPNVTSRFGMKTFTVVPPKPPVVHAPVEEKASTTPGAIKIDEQGNMVKVPQYRAANISHSGDGHESPLLGKAKVFWSSNEKQDGAVSQNKGLTDKSKGSLNNNKSTWIKPSETTVTTIDTRSVKTFQETVKCAPQIQPKETVEDNTQLAKDTECNDKTKEGDNIGIFQSSQKPAVPPPFISDVRRDLFFLKPSRRTSSQYVASAITKYTPKTTFKPDNNFPTPESPLKTQNTVFQKSGRSIQINPTHSFRSSNSNNLGFTSNPPGPKRSVSYPEYICDRQDDNGEVVKKLEDLEKSQVHIKESCRPQETPKLANEQSVSPKHLNGKIFDSFKTVQPSSPSPAPSSYSTQSNTDFKNGHKDQNNSVMDLATNPSKPEEKPSVTELDRNSGPPAVAVFGPVKKFKPVICRSVEKETTLHSSLMEAIQSGGGKERLKKISTSGVSNMKKASFVEEENERSALMAAIRAQGSTGRLRKTKSEAAEELERFKRDVPEEQGSTQILPGSTSFSSPSVQASVPPPVPHAQAVAPPPPPPVLPPKSFPLSQPNMSMNPAVAREAMLEAIRSGSAAERLKKVTVPAKTVQVNGKLGTIKTTSSTMS